LLQPPYHKSNNYSTGNYFKSNNNKIGLREKLFSCKTIEQKGMILPRLWLFFSPFLFPPKKRGKRKEE
jgi:hypothetical protein